MKLRKARIQNFKSIRDSGEITIDPRVTVLIGKNEDGKTNILQALSSFDEESYKESDLCSYSAAAKKSYAGELAAKDIEILTLWFELEQDEFERLRGTDPGLPRDTLVKATKRFNGDFNLEFEGYSPPGPESVSEPPAKELQESVSDFVRRLKEHAARYATFQPSIEPAIAALVGLRKEPQTWADFRTATEQATTKLQALPNQDQEIQNEIQTFGEKLQSLSDAWPESPPRPSLDEAATDFLPRFVYFADIDRLGDVVRIADYNANPAAFTTFRRLFQLAGLDVARVGTDPHARATVSRNASVTITGLVNDSWKQDKVNLDLRVDGENVVISIEDATGAMDPPSRRSQGFQWFLSFYTEFTAASGGEFKNTVLLLDDPGVYLHPSGQRDLLSTLERLSDSNQFLIATHSPFLIDRQRLDRVRIVQKKGSREGTKVLEDITKSERDALEPLRAALGVTLGDSLFLSKHNVIVEGYSDYLMLDGLSRYFAKTGTETLRVDDVAIIAVGGANNIRNYVLLVFKEKLRFAAVLDSDLTGRGVIADLKKRVRVPDKSLILVEEAHAAQPGVDIEMENLFDPDFYNDAVNEAYKAILKQRGITEIKADDLDAGISKTTKKYEALFDRLDLGGFDVEMVAREVFEMATAPDCTDERLGDRTVRNFRELLSRVKLALS